MRTFGCSSRTSLIHPAVATASRTAPSGSLAASAHSPKITSRKEEDAQLSRCSDTQNLGQKEQQEELMEKRGATSNNRNDADAGRPGVGYREQVARLETR